MIKRVILFFIGLLALSLGSVHMSKNYELLRSPAF